MSQLANPLRRSLQARMLAAFLMVTAVMIGIGVFGMVQQDRVLDRATAMSVRDVTPLADIRSAQSAHDQTIILGTVLENVQDAAARAGLQQALDAQAAAAQEGLHLSDQLQGVVSRFRY